jgi:hypothetical protein
VSDIRTLGKIFQNKSADSINKLFIFVCCFRLERIRKYRQLVTAVNDNASCSATTSPLQSSSLETEVARKGIFRSQKREISIGNKFLKFPNHNSDAGAVYMTSATFKPHKFLAILKRITSCSGVFAYSIRLVQ